LFRKGMLSSIPERSALSVTERSVGPAPARTVSPILVRKKTPATQLVMLTIMSAAAAHAQSAAFGPLHEHCAHEDHANEKVQDEQHVLHGKGYSRGSAPQMGRAGSGLNT